jgi:hypothetical protein
MDILLQTIRLDRFSFYSYFTIFWSK